MLSRGSGDVVPGGKGRSAGGWSRRSSPWSSPCRRSPAGRRPSARRRAGGRRRRPRRCSSCTPSTAAFASAPAMISWRPGEGQPDLVAHDERRIARGLRPERQGRRLGRTIPSGPRGPADGASIGRDMPGRRHDPGQLGHAALEPLVVVLAAEALEEGVDGSRGDGRGVRISL